MDKNKKIRVYDDLNHALSEFIKDFALTNSLSAKDLVPWFSVMLVGQLSMCGYSEEFVKKSFERMFERYKEKMLDKK